MRKLTALLAVIFVTLVLVSSCANKASPESVAKDFLVRLNNLDFTGAAILSTREGVENVKMLESLMGMTPPEELEKQKAAAKAKPVKIVSSKQTGDTAVVTYQLGESASQTLNMKKVDGLWKVDFTKGV